MGNCNKKEHNRDMIQDEISAARDRPEKLKNMMPGSKMVKQDRESDSEEGDSQDSYSKIGCSMMNLPDQHTNSTDIPGNLWQVETRTFD